MTTARQGEASNLSAFESAVVENLNKAGKEGREIARFMLDGGIHIASKRTWYPNWFSAWWDARRRMVFLDAQDFPARKLRPDNPFLLNIIAHELDHIRITNETRGSLIPAGLTKYGEIRGWKTGYVVQHQFTGHAPLPGTVIHQLIHLDLDSAQAVREGSRIIRAHQKRVKLGWVYSFFFSLLPPRPGGRRFST